MHISKDIFWFHSTLGTTRSDYFTSESAQRLIGQIMAWNQDMDQMRNRLDRMQQEMKDMIDVLGRI